MSTEPPLSPGSAARPRAGSGQLNPEWNTKAVELRIKKPLHRRTWFRRTALVLGLLTLVGGGSAAFVLRDWHREQLAELARQRRGVDAFLRSDEFAAFSREVDAQFLAAINFTVTRPDAVRNLWPVAIEFERRQNILPWHLELLPLPVSTTREPARIAAAMDHLGSLLTRRGVVFDEAAQEQGRLLFLRLLGPQMENFLRRAPEHAFPSIGVDRALQERMVLAYAARTRENVSPADALRPFAIYAVIGPPLWNELDQVRAKLPPPPR